MHTFQIKKIAIAFLLITTVFSVNRCVMEKPEQQEEGANFERLGVEVDLPEIIEKGKLTVLVENSSTTYFIYKGKKMGFEYNYKQSSLRLLC